MSEKVFQAQIVDLARAVGFKQIYHTYSSRRSAPGFPDLVLIRDRVIFIEVKAERGKLSEAQKGWLRALQQAGCDAFVVRPRDLESLAQVLAARIPAPIVLGRCGAADRLRAATMDEAA